MKSSIFYDPFVYFSRTLEGKWCFQITIFILNLQVSFRSLIWEIEGDNSIINIMSQLGYLHPVVWKSVKQRLTSGPQSLAAKDSMNICVCLHLTYPKLKIRTYFSYLYLYLFISICVCVVSIYMTVNRTFKHFFHALSVFFCG